jgi:hypothetical protein
MKIIPVNGSDRDWTRQRFILSFGAYGWTALMVWANSLDDALDEAVDWLADNAPGLLCDDAVNEEYQRGIAAGMSEEDAIEAAEVDTTRAGNNGHYLLSYEWGIVSENPTRKQILELQSL